MFAQLLIVMILFGLLFWGLWSGIGKKIIEKLYPVDTKELRSNLNKKIRILKKMKNGLELKSKEVDVTKKINKIRKELLKTENQLRKLDKDDEN